MIKLIHYVLPYERIIIMNSIETTGIPCDEDNTLVYGQRTTGVDKLRDIVTLNNTKLHWGFGLKHRRDFVKLDTIIKQLSLPFWKLDTKPKVAHSFYGPRWLLASSDETTFILFTYLNASFIPGISMYDENGNPFNNIQCNYAAIPLSAIIKDGSYVPGYSHDNILQAYAQSNNRGFQIRSFAIRASTIAKLIQLTNQQRENEINIWGFNTIPTYKKALSKEQKQWITAFREAKLTQLVGYRIASAAILGSPIEFIVNIKRFMRFSDWKTRKIMPSLGLLTQKQKDAGPQPLYYWLRPDVCHQCMGIKAYGNILEIVMSENTTNLRKYI